MSYMIGPSYLHDDISRWIPDTITNLFSCKWERGINYCNDTWEKVEENKILAQSMDCSKKFKKYCKYQNVEIEINNPEFYRRYMQVDVDIVNI